MGCAVIDVNGRRYANRTEPVVAICLDGCDPSYLEAAVDVMPELATIRSVGFSGLVKTVVPSYTNPNNVAIVTGTTSNVNGIPGNYYYDAQTNQEVMMNDPVYMRAPTILSAFSAAGRRVAAVTTKDKLRTILAEGLNGICCSVECADQAIEAEHGIGDVVSLVGRENPGIYDPEASVFCLESGVRLLEYDRADLIYLSTTDYVQHKFEPGTSEANHFYGRLDRFLGELHRLGAIVGITADHGMNAKVQADGTPNVQYLDDVLRDGGLDDVRVILPITDPYVVHHGSLGSCATVYVNPTNLDAAIQLLRETPGIEEVLPRMDAAQKYLLPPDRIGDLFVLGDRETVLGRTREVHDLSLVQQGLRSHGGVHEATVPMIVNRPLVPEYVDRMASGQMRNFDLFDVLCNGVA